jgi:L-cysteine/cystine lyase
MELRDRLRERLAALLHVPAENVALTGSTTEGCHVVLSGLGLRPEDEVVTTDAEHPGLLGPLASSGASVRVARVLERPAAEAAEAVLAAVTPRTRLIALSHVLWLNGHVLPIAEIRRRSGLPLLVDGAQSVGAIAVDAGEADYYTVSGQKWLCGPELTGALYVADPDSLRPRLVLDAANLSYERRGATRLEMLFHPAALTAGLLSAMEELPPDAFERGATMARRCREALLDAGLEVLSEPGQGTLVAFRAPQDPAQVVAACEAEGVVIRYLPNGWLRASCGWWTSDEDVERLVAALCRLR